MNALLIAIGSHGDVHPFVGLGLALRARGHDVTVVTNPHFEPLVRRVGLDFSPLGTREEYEQMAHNPNLWHPIKGFHLIVSSVMNLVRPTYETIVSRLGAEGVVVASSLALGARVAQDRRGIPTASVHLQPAMFRTLFDHVRQPGLPMPSWSPRLYKRFIFSVVQDKLFVDRVMGPRLNAFRAELGMGPVRRIMADYWHSPELTIGLFPDWFGPPQPDWPPQTRLTGFPLYDEQGLRPLDEKLVRFLEGGTPPIAFTPGSANWRAERFFEAAVETCRLLGRRGVLLSRQRDHIPPGLPPEVLHADYAPFSDLLPRCAAVVHHGGIGSSAQGLAAGVPQLATVMAFDQLDNARRLERLGVGRWVMIRKFTGRRGSELLGQLLNSPEVAAACERLKAKLAGARPLDEACGLIERLGARSRSNVRPAPAPAEAAVN